MLSAHLTSEVPPLSRRVPDYPVQLAGVGAATAAQRARSATQLVPSINPLRTRSVRRPSSVPEGRPGGRHPDRVSLLLFMDGNQLAMTCTVT